MRKPIIAGNWKMNKTNADTKAMITELLPLVANAECEVVLCTPFTALATAVEAAKGTNVKIGAENVHFAKSGAYTGEISAEMLVDLGVEYVIVGHSERRQYFAETDSTVNLRTVAALEAGLKVMVCCGETLAEREAGNTQSVNERQILGAFEGFTTDMFENVVVAYEPVWAIGTGVTATDEEANDTIGYIRSVVSKRFGNDVADRLRIQYGGSMNPKNVKGLMAKPEIDGGLIGGASLNAVDFSNVVNFNA